jgi:hypothetical protein
MVSRDGSDHDHYFTSAPAALLVSFEAANRGLVRELRLTRLTLRSHRGEKSSYGFVALSRLPPLETVGRNFLLARSVEID